MTAGDIKKLITYWLGGSELDWSTHNALAKSNHDGSSLFYLHLSMEKLIKAIIVKQTKSHAPFNHNLVFLLGKTNIQVSENILADLAKITDFNISTRHPADVHEFYSSTTKEQVKIWHKKAKLIRDQLRPLLGN